MAAFFTAALKGFQGSKEEPPKGPPKDGKVATLPNGMAREEFEEYQRQLLEEKIERDKAFAQRKAERATVRMHLRDKYHLAQRAANSCWLGRTSRLPTCPSVRTWDWTVLAPPDIPSTPRDPPSPVPAPRLLGDRSAHVPAASPPDTQDERDDAQLHVAGGTVELPQELAAMVHSEEEEEEEDGAGAFAFLMRLREVDLSELRGRALGTVDEVKEKCALM
ncbi:hypothetical protein AV530_004702 [Patagioenas fasciata monilis]|uniref:Complexin-3 n=1 Tax=Patagioenas fasciata monilis TaxID=372326 RepID=A0A1V4JZN6_PATFA|nr:hypothetical protein AV530_004702 [Patagioenas fasciata monilis]